MKCAASDMILMSSTSHRRVFPLSLLPKNRLSLVVVIAVTILLLAPTNSEAASTRGHRCQRIADQHAIDEPGCEVVAVDVFRCGGRCLSFSFPSSDNILSNNPEQMLTVRAKYCRMTEIEMISVGLTCSDGLRTVDIPSAVECSCSSHEEGD